MPKRLDAALSYSSNDQYIWTNHDPDLELVEPPILVSISRNHMKFGHKEQRPPISYTFNIVNHGEFSVAFKILTTDNFIYFVDQKYGIIPGRCLHGFPNRQLDNMTVIEVFRRPFGYIHPDHATPYFNVPKKDRLHILLTVAHSFSIPPAAYFHSEMSYEKLRICLEYTAAEPNNADDDARLHKRAPGWRTWTTKTGKDLGKRAENVKEAVVPLEIAKPKADVKRKKRGKWGPVAKEKQIAEERKKMNKDKPSENHKMEDISRSLEKSVENYLDRSLNRLERSASKRLEKQGATVKHIPKISEKFPKDWNRPDGRSVWEPANRPWEAPVRPKKKQKTGAEKSRKSVSGVSCYASKRSRKKEAPNNQATTDRAENVEVDKFDPVLKTQEKRQ